MGVYFAAIVWVYLLSNVRGVLRKVHVYAAECVTTVQGHPSH